MASSKRIGFFWSQEKITLVVFEKNALQHAVSLPLGSKSDSLSPFRSNFSEEIQLTNLMQKMLQDGRTAGGAFYISLPMQEIILRSFVIPSVKQSEMQNAVRFEAKKYLPIDIQELSFVFYTVPFIENKVRRLQVIFFAVRKESLLKYVRIFKQSNVEIAYAEPSVISLAKVLLFNKDISPSDHLAFLILEGFSGSICFINRGIPQFVREFSIGPAAGAGEVALDSAKTQNLKVLNEVGNSFDFYARQFGGDSVEHLLVSSEGIGDDLVSLLGTELKLKIKRIAPIGATGENNDMAAIYAMGVCVDPSINSLAGFNFLGTKPSAKMAIQTDLLDLLKSSRDLVLIFLLCLVSLGGAAFFFQTQLKVLQKQYAQLSLQEGSYLDQDVDAIQGEITDNVNTLASYKSIRTRSDMVPILFRISSHLPKGAFLQSINMSYDQGDTANVSIDINGVVYQEDSSEEIAVVDQIFSDFKNDKDLAQYVKDVNLVSLSSDTLDGKTVMKFSIHCS